MMGLLDEALGKSTPGGDISKPLMIALGALLVSKMFNGNEAASLQPSATPPQANNAADTPDGGLLGGLGGLLKQLQASGLGDKADSWVGSGQNKPIDPGQLGSALGQKTVSNVAQKAGVSEQELLSQLAQNLPAIVDKLTANGRIPSLQDVAAALTQQR